MSHSRASRSNIALRALSFVALFAIAIPWYWRWLGDLAYHRVVGVPAWFAVAVVASIGISINAAWQLGGSWASDIDEAEQEASQ